MKKTLCSLLLAATAFAFTSCGDSSDPQALIEAAKTPEQIAAAAELAMKKFGENPKEADVAAATKFGEAMQKKMESLSQEDVMKLMKLMSEIQPK